jgi:exodeoxyribonuclease VII small subunit
MPSKATAKPTDSPDAPSFEAALTRLEEIVNRLERGDITLDESLAVFREGSGLVKLCLTRLSEAEATVEELMAGDGGAPTTVPARPGLDGADDETA